MRKGIKIKKQTCPECGKELTEFDGEPYCPEDGGMGMPESTPEFVCTHCGWDDTMEQETGVNK